MARSLFFTLFLVLSAVAAPVPAGATEAGWALLREGGKIVLLRHANAPGTGDPANFDIENCRTQRNLSDRGRQQARRIGSLFAARAAPVERVLASRYCRTTETATLAFGERLVEPFEALDPPATDDEAEAGLPEALIAEIEGFTGSGNFVLVTHEESIRALTGAGAREGEAVIVVPAGDTLQVSGRIVFN